jgi:hypothetical protein
MASDEPKVTRGDSINILFIYLGVGSCRSLSTCFPRCTRTLIDHTDSSFPPPSQAVPSGLSLSPCPLVFPMYLFLLYEWNISMDMDLSYLDPVRGDTWVLFGTSSRRCFYAISPVPEAFR